MGNDVAEEILHRRLDPSHHGDVSREMQAGSIFDGNSTRLTIHEAGFVAQTQTGVSGTGLSRQASPGVGGIGSAADATNTWGSLTAQPGSGYAGLGLGNKACLMNGEAGGITVKDAPGLHFSGNITMMAWVKPAVKDFFRDIIAHGWAGNKAETFLRISRNNGDVFPNQ